MGFKNQQNGYVKVGDLIKAIVDDMLANGFVQKFPSTPLAAADTFSVTLEAGPTVDPLAATQPWRIRFEVTSIYQAKAYVASPTQLPDTGGTSLMEVGFSTVQDTAGVIGSDLPYPYKLDANTLIVPPAEINTNVTYDVESIARSKRINDADRMFIDRSIRIPDIETAQTYPMSYQLVISDHGAALCVWEEGQDLTGDKFSWFVVQRPVDRATGAVMDDPATKCPVFCVYGLKDQYVPAAVKKSISAGTQDQIIYPERWEPGQKRFVVRENDVLKPTPSVPASYDTEDAAAILNTKQQVAITEDNKYVVVFPSRLNTPRYAYTHELDMLGYTSADVISQYTEVPVTVFGEPTERKYKALMANGPNNTKMRLMFLVEGGGV